MSGESSFMREWVKRAIAFTQKLATVFPEAVQEVSTKPPLTKAELLKLQIELGRPLPDPIADFVTIAASSCDCKYFWTLNRYESIVGGANLCQARFFKGYIQVCKSFGEDADDLKYARLCRRAFPFAAILNGDYLALDVLTDPVEPPVVYLSHEGEQLRPIAPNFQSFLREWENLFYIDPISSVLEDYINPQTGYLNSSSSSAESLRQYFQSIID